MSACRKHGFGLIVTYVGRETVGTGEARFPAGLALPRPPLFHTPLTALHQYINNVEHDRNCHDVRRRPGISFPRKHSAEMYVIPPV